MVQNKKGGIKAIKERSLFSNIVSWEDLPGDEFKCIIKCLSQCTDSAGTQVTKECSATPTLRVQTGYQAKLSLHPSSEVCTLGSDNMSTEWRHEYRCTMDQGCPNIGSRLTSESQTQSDYLGQSSREALENWFICSRFMKLESLLKKKEKVITEKITSQWSYA